ncbi:MAG: TetR/AcrR family transcriptional regulator [Burkholderiaceae bacterium]
MAQTKKEGVRDAILEAAFRLFSEKGYVDTSIPAIAREAGISTANVYVYFTSKVEVLYTLYEPWLMHRLDKLGHTLERIADPRERFQRLLTALWRELPRESNGFANNVMQALSTTSGEEYDPHLRELFQTRVARWIESCIPIGDDDAHRLAGVLLMAFDGFAMNAHLGRGVSCGMATLRQLGATLFDGATAARVPRG